MGIVPITLPAGIDRHAVCQDGRESLTFEGLDRLQVGNNAIGLTVSHPQRAPRELVLGCRVDCARELDYLAHGGLLPFVLRRICAASARTRTETLHA
jgi:aconitate hydratase